MSLHDIAINQEEGFLDIGVLLRMAIFFCFIILLSAVLMMFATENQVNLVADSNKEITMSQYLKSQTMTVGGYVYDTFGVKQVHTGDNEYYYVVIGNNPKGFTVYQLTESVTKVHKNNSAAGDGLIIRLPKFSLGLKGYVFLVNY